MIKILSITNYNMIRKQIKKAIEKQYPENLRNRQEHYTQNDIAKLIKVSSGNFSRFLSGKIPLSLKKIELCLSLLKLEIKSKE